MTDLQTAITSIGGLAGVAIVAKGVHFTWKAAQAYVTRAQDVAVATERRHAEEAAYRAEVRASLASQSTRLDGVARGVDDLRHRVARLEGGRANGIAAVK